MALHRQRGSGFNSGYDDIRAHATNGDRFAEDALASRLTDANLRIRTGPHPRDVIHGR
jgi:hypothetical protein